MKEYAYALITPYSIHKSRTGGIIGRILLHTDLDLCAVNMYAPSNGMVDEYIAAIQADPLSEHNKKLFCDYINVNLRANNPSGISNRCMLLVLEGQDATSILRRTIGHITYKPVGDTVRGTYGDYITHNNDLVYFEPAVINAWDGTAARKHLKIFKKYACSDGGVIAYALDNFIENKEQNQTTLVMLKPDSSQKGSGRPGNIIDMFSKTALYIVGARLVYFSLAQAEEFYEPLKDIFEKKLEDMLKNKIENLFDTGLPFQVNDGEIDNVTEILCKKNARFEFNRIIEYITGLNPETTADVDKMKPGPEKCLAMLYYGNNAVAKIREKLGSTDPRTAKGGTVRSEFGYNILKNGAHASDTAESAERERRIIGLSGNENNQLDGVEV